MGSYDGAEICELVGLLILNDLSKLVQKSDAGLYRDDGLIVVRNMRARSTEKLRKNIIEMFKNFGLQIEIATNLPIVDFLDITLNLKNGTYRPYKKPNDSLMYVHTSSNHPQQILKQLPKSLSERLSKNSSNEMIFNEAKNDYEEALKKSGYKDVKLEYKKPTPKKKRNRSRNIIWFNPPFSCNVSTNIGKKFLSLIKKHFKSDHLKKLFNKNNVKVSYSCTENMGSIIRKHNSKVATKDERKSHPPCNCRNKNNCPLQGDCRRSSVVYKCEITTPVTPKKVYIGLTEQEFKDRWNAHKTSFNNRKYQHSTTLSTYVWQLKDQHNVNPKLKWSIVKQAKGYTNTSKSCALCLQEKFEILKYPSKKELLNKRSELISKCRHSNKFLLANYKSKD